MLHTRTIDPRTLELLKSLMAKPCLNPFFLVGGTALALQLGHRLSIDLDFFSMTDFDQDDLLTDLRQDFQVVVETKSPSIFITQIEGVKVDFVRFRYKTLFPELNIDGVRMLELRDIAPMKLDAVTKRGSKKDFYDIYFLLEKLTLPELLDLYAQKFEHATIFHVIKSLTYFDDAEDQPDPVVFEKKHSWKKVKTAIEKAAQKTYR